MVYTYCKKLRILYFHLKRLRAPEIEKRLLQEGLVFVKRYAATESIGQLPGSGCICKSKVTDKIKRIVEDQVKADDETSAFTMLRYRNIAVITP